MLLDRLLASVERFSDKPALIDAHVTLSYAQLRGAAGYFSRIIGQRCKTENVGILLPSCAAFAPVFYGCRWAGRTAVPLNFLLISDELRGVVDDAGADTIFTIRHFESLVAPMGRQIIYVDDEMRKLAGLARKLALLPAFLRPKPPRKPDFRPDDTAVILYTSGTSGKPKGVMLSEQNLCQNADECISRANMYPTERCLCVLPLFHSFGMLGMLIAPMTIGGTSYFLPRFSPVATVKMVREHRIAALMAVPSMFSAMLQLKDIPADSFATMQLLVSGGEPLPAAVLEGVKNRFGAQLLEGYGLTETSPVVALNTQGQNRAGTVGVPLQSWELRIVPDGSPHPGPTGELWLRGPCLTSGYYKNPQATADAITPDGWFKTGDIASLDGDGYLTINGRKKEMIIVAGENVFPAGIEQVLQDHPAVAACAVIGRRDDLRGEQIVAYVSLAEGAVVTPAELRDHCRERMAAYKVPREVIIRPNLPRGPTGKVLKRALHNPPVG